jgi:hypothetical protein
MRITREFIQKFAQEAINRRTRSDRDILAVYLCGSFLQENFLLGGAGDVDLFFIHSSPPQAAREIVRMTDEVHLDIAHRDQKEFRDTRSLRVNPWLGPTMNSCKILYDPQHFLDFVQASVRGQYDRPDHVYQRVRPQADQAREIWFQLQAETDDDGLKVYKKYLEAVGKSANAIASLVGAPIPERRLLLEFRSRAEAADRPGLFNGLLGLLGAPNCSASWLKDRLKDWADAFQALSDGERRVRYHPARFQYYQAAFKEMLESEEPQTLLWPLLSTWSDLISALPVDSVYRTDWQRAMEALGLYGSGLEERIRAFDAYLDMVEETLETWAEANGVWETS